MNAIFHRQVAAVVLTALFTGAMLAVAPHARADDAKPAPTLTPSVTVRFADLNRSSPEGVRALYDRIADAANTVCGPSESVWDKDGYRDWQTCYRATIDNAVRQINRPELTALHQKVTGHRASQARLPTANPPQG